MKKLFVLGLCLSMVVSMLSGCSTGQKKDKTESDSSASSSEAETSKTEVTTTETSEKESETSESESKSAVTESKAAVSESKKAAGAVAPTGDVDGLSDKYVDYENRSFAVNGKAYTLGVNTLQDMIDDGVPFDEDDLADANNNVKPNYESQGFKIELGEYYSAQVYVSNFSDENATLASCVLSQVYLPVSLDKEQDVIQFSFPLTITEEELIAQAGEPTENKEYKSDDGNYVSHDVNYLQKSEKYLGTSGYKFEFANGSLRYLYIDYLP